MPRSRSLLATVVIICLVLVGHGLALLCLALAWRESSQHRISPKRLLAEMQIIAQDETPPPPKAPPALASQSPSKVATRLNRQQQALPVQAKTAVQANTPQLSSNEPPSDTSSSSGSSVNNETMSDTGTPTETVNPDNTQSHGTEQPAAEVVAASLPNNVSLENNATLGKQTSNENPFAHSIGRMTHFGVSREFIYVGYLNGAAVARGVYRFEVDSPRYVATFAIKATGMTSWIWRGDREEKSIGTLTEAGLIATQLESLRPNRSALQRKLEPGVFDSVGLVQQLALMGANFPNKWQPGFTWKFRFQKTSRVDEVTAQVLPLEQITIDGVSQTLVPISFGDQTIWYAPAMDWAPVRLRVPAGNYQVEFRLQGMPPPAKGRENDGP